MAQAVYRNYARVLLELEIGEDDLELAKVLLQDKSIFRVLNHPFIKRKEKIAVIKRLFPKSMHKFLAFLYTRGRKISFLQILEAYEDIKNEAKGKLQARLECFEEPQAKQLEEIEDFLKEKHHAKEVEIKIEKRTDLIGGFILTVGNFEYDWSIKGRIKRLKDKINGR